MLTPKSGPRRGAGCGLNGWVLRRGPFLLLSRSPPIPELLQAAFEMQIQVLPSPPLLFH